MLLSEFRTNFFILDQIRHRFRYLLVRRYALESINWFLKTLEQQLKFISGFKELGLAELFDIYLALPLFKFYTKHSGGH